MLKIRPVRDRAELAETLNLLSGELPERIERSDTHFDALADSHP